MSTERQGPSTLALELSAASARTRVAADVEELAEQLQPEQLKNRALDAVEHSLASLVSRAVSRLKTAPSLAVAYARRHPFAAVAAGAATAALVWRVSRRRR